MSSSASPAPDAAEHPPVVEIEREIDAHKILVYGKGTKTMPRCGFTLETIEFFTKFGYPFEVIDVLGNDQKRAALSELTNWPTLPKIFIDGTFYGDTDILGPMEASGELAAILEKTFGAKPAQNSVINLREG